MGVLLLLGSFFIFFSFFLSISRFLRCLIILENLKVLVLLVRFMCCSVDHSVLFVLLIVMFTIEVVLGLVILVQL